MNGPAITIVSEVRKRQIPGNITYMWTLKYDTDEHILTQTHRHREQTCHQDREGVREGRIGSLGLSVAN